ncbi:FMN-dependent NADH-azoreductase [Oscillatoria sp. FACHB-1406]|uniref:FMN-dependent NADH-azoreductase n=1 Tax=Oscillatoria sp. FACHB-1406 TaxID=2692846 RepID=UPI0016832E0D|nr:FMN-dependent NADH-azoreductase [Oscillatoria sp. FACHB-1406]MBD2576326.1 FMN-dependent NADH-azoreductase [Oscillatoria sp. FACHB-1406]
MTKILHLDSSPRGQHSVSGRLAGEFIGAWQAAHPDDEVVYRNLGRNPISHIDESWIMAAFTPPAQHTPDLTAAIQLSNVLIEELLECDRYVFSIPMYNLSVPSVFKAYIDQIVRVNCTFKVTENGYEGLVNGKKMLVITARGGIYADNSPMADFDFQAPYLRAIFNLIGVTDISFIHADGLSMGEEARDRRLNRVQDEISALLESW